MAASYELVTSAERLGHVANEILDSPCTGLDIETTGYDPKVKDSSSSPFRDDIRILSISTGKGTYVIDHYATKTLEPVVKALGESKGVKVGQNCLTGDSRIELADGSRMPLRSMVKQKHPGPVLTMNEVTGAIEAKRVVGWIKAGTRAWDDWLSVEFRGKHRLRLTKDHVVLTSRGRVAAQDLVVGDRVYTPRKALTSKQEALIYGTLLGDASIRCDVEANARSPIMTFSHALSQEQYALWKSDILGELVSGFRVDKAPRITGFAKNGTQQRHTWTISDSRFFEAFDLCLKNDVKHLSTGWIDKLSPAALAVWLGDDGSHSQGVGIAACVTSLGSEAYRLVDWIIKQGWPAEIVPRSSDGHPYLKIRGRLGRGVDPEMQSFWETVGPFFPECMAYKVPVQFRHLAGTGWEKFEDADRRFAEEIILVRGMLRERDETGKLVEGRYNGCKKVGKGPQQYCLTVEDNPNFVANDRFVSNCKYEQKWFLQKYDTELWPIFDTYRASALIYNGKKLPHDLYSLYERELKIAPPTRDLGGSNWGGTLTPEQLDYAASDVAHLHDLRDVLKAKLAKDGLNKVALIEFGAILPESAVELNGFPIDQKMWLDLATENAAKAEALRKQLVWELPNPKPQLSLLGFEPNLNLDSPTQMLASLRKLGIQQICEGAEGTPCRKGRTRDGGVCELCEGSGIVELQNTREMTVMMHAADYPVIKKFIEYKGYSKSVASFGPDYLEWVDPSTGRIHSSYFPFTEAGRYSNAKPNLQQINRDKRFRQCFRAAPGNKLKLADYSNIEMRIIAELSQDPRLMKIFRDGEDAHYVTAAALMGLTIDQVSTDQRQQAKPVNFGFCIAEGQLVLTNQGLVPIENVTVDQLVWDGLEWVAHEGVIAMGIKNVIECDGLVATPDHMVFTDRGFKLPFGAYALNPASLFGSLGVGASGPEPVFYDAFDRVNGTLQDPTIALAYKQARVYDLLNAGPRHRFTVENVIVSNCYGMMPPKMVLYAMANYGIALTLKQSTEFRSRFFELYSRLPGWHRELLDAGERTHKIRNKAGRVRYMTEDAHNEYLNTPVQGLGAEGLKASLRECYFRFKKYSKWNGPIKMIHHVHDEIITEITDDPEVDAFVDRELKAGMEAGMVQFVQSVPVVIESKGGSSWGAK